jgi:hypothetical protein
MAWISKRSEAIESFDNDVFFNIESKRTYLIVENLFRSEANMFILKNLNIEAKRSKLNCESSKVKRTCSIVKKIITKRSEHVYIEEFKNRSESNMFVSSKIYFLASEHVYI